MADPTYFVGRYPGAAIPAAPVAPPSQFVPRFDTNAHGLTQAISGAGAVSGVPAPKPIVTPDAVPMMAATGINGVPVQVPAIVPASTGPISTATAARQANFLANAPNYVPAPAASAPAGAAPALPPVYNASGNEQVNLPPLPDGMPGDDSVATPAQVAGVSSVSGGGAVSAGSRLVDPSAAIKTGYDQQLAYLHSALQEIMGAARAGSPGNYSFRLGHLVGAMGQNNFGQVQGQGADALNAATAGIQQSENYAGASRYGADSTLLGNMNTNATAGDIAANTPHPVSQHTGYNQYGMPTGSDTIYGTPGHGAVTPIATPGNGVVPTLENFLSRARASNPGMTDEQLTTYYRQKYGTK